MAAVIKLKGFDGQTPIRVAGTAVKDSAAQRIVARDGELVTGEFPLDKVDIWYNESEPVIQSSTPISRDDLLHLTWSLSWPCALFSLAYQLVRAALPFEHATLAGLDLAFGVASLFFYSTWVVRRAVGLEFPAFHLLVVRRTGEVTRTMNYAESLSVAWLLCWRTVVIMIPLLIVMVMVKGSTSAEWSFTNWLVTSLADLLIFYVWVIPSAVRKNYAGFSLRLAARA